MSFATDPTSRAERLRELSEAKARTMRVAREEAGHAVAAWNFGWTVTGADVTPGRCSMKPEDLSAEDKAIEAIAIRLVGVELSPDSVRLPWWPELGVAPDDLRGAEQIASESPWPTDDIMARARSSARAFVNDPRCMELVRRLSEELAVRHVLTGGEIDTHLSEWSEAL